MPYPRFEDEAVGWIAVGALLVSAVLITAVIVFVS